MQTTTKSWWQDLLLLTILISILYGAFLGSRPLAVPDEARYTEIPREMIASGNYLTPHLNGFVYFEKPVVFYWLQALPLKLFGINEWAARLMTALMGLLGCLMTYLAARKLFNRSTAWLSTLILVSTPLYYAMAHMITIDMTLSIFLCASLFCFLLGTQESAGSKRNYYMWGMYTFAALTVLTKGLIGIVFPGLIIFAWVLLFNKWRELKTYCIPSGILLLLLIAAPWHLLVQFKNPEFFDYYFIKQQFTRYATNYAGRNQPLWFLPTVLVVGLLPWVGFLGQSLGNTASNKPLVTRLFGNEITTYLLLWTIIIFVFFWLSHSQLIPYILPIFPPIAILIGNYVSELQNKPHTKGLRYGFIIAAGLLLLLSATCLIAPQFIEVVSKKAAYKYLIPSALFFALGAGLNIFFYRRQQLIRAIISMAFTLTLAFINLNLGYTTFVYSSIKPLATQLKSLAKPSDAVVSYDYYYQDMPVYLGRTVIVTNNIGELEFGVHQPHPNGIYLTDAQLWQVWHSKQRVFMIMDTHVLNNLRKDPQKKFFIINETPGDVLVSNQQP